MAAPSGIAGQFAFAAETTYGTAVTASRFLPFTEESIQTEFTPLESDGILAGARVLRSSQWAQGVFKHAGDIGLELTPRGCGVIFQHALGSITTANTTVPYTFTATPGDMTGLGLTMQIGRPDIGGTVRPFTYAGVKIASWELAVAAGEFATLGLSVVAQTVTTVTGLASASYSDTTPPFKFSSGSFALAGSSLCVRSAKISGDNGLDTDRTCIGHDYVEQPLESKLREYTGEVELEFPDLIHYNRFIAGTEGNLTLTLTQGSASAKVIGNVRTDQATPMVKDRGILVQTMSFKCVGTNSDASALSIVYTTTDSTP